MSDRPSKTASLKSIAADLFTSSFKSRFVSRFVYGIALSLTLIIVVTLVTVDLSSEVKRGHTFVID